MNNNISIERDENDANKINSEFYCLDYIVERKAFEDLASSIIDTRYEN